MTVDELLALIPAMHTFYAVLYHHPANKQHEVWFQLYSTMQAAKRAIEQYNTEMCERVNEECDLNFDTELKWYEDEAYNGFDGAHYPINIADSGFDGVYYIIQPVFLRDDEAR